MVGAEGLDRQINLIPGLYECAGGACQATSSNFQSQLGRAWYRLHSARQANPQKQRDQSRMQLPSLSLSLCLSVSLTLSAPVCLIVCVCLSGTRYKQM